MKPNNRLLSLLLALSLSMPALSLALSTDKDQPMYLEADSVDIDDAKGVSIYEGNVVITQGSTKLWADKIWVYRVDGETEKVFAIGKPVRFQQRMDDSDEVARGQALRAEYYARKDEIYLIGEALLEQGKDQFRSDRITYLRGKSQVKAGASAAGKKRVRVVIEPRKEQQ